MAGICCGVVGEVKASSAIEPSSRASRRRRLELLPLKLIADVAIPPALENGQKRQKIDLCPPSSPPIEFEKAVKTCVSNQVESNEENEESRPEIEAGSSGESAGLLEVQRDLCLWKEKRHRGRHFGFHFFGVFDGHGCSHVAAKCRDRLHDIMKEEVEGEEEAQPINFRSAPTRFD